MFSVDDHSLFPIDCMIGLIRMVGDVDNEMYKKCVAAAAGGQELDT